jgi:hypothetical protein
LAKRPWFRAEIHGVASKKRLDSVFSTGQGDLMALTVPIVRDRSREEPVIARLYEETRKGWVILPCHVTGTPPGIIAVVPRPPHGEEEAS